VGLCYLSWGGGEELKAPAFQFYPSDWQRDMDDFPLEIEGAWIRICCRLYWSEGTATKTLKQWSSILRADLRQTRRIFAFFLLHDICDLVNQNGSITITSRRIVRDEYIRQIRKEAGIKGGNPRLKNHVVLFKQNDEQKPTPSSSSSSSLKESSKRKTCKRSLTDEEFFEMLKTNPAYSGIDISLQKGKCEAWCITNGKLFSQRRFLNWLNRVDKPIISTPEGYFANGT
jgi:hypothetical protein